MSKYDRIVESLSSLKLDELEKLENELSKAIVDKSETEENINVFLSSLQDYFNHGLTLTLYPEDWRVCCFEERTLCSVEDFKDVISLNSSWESEEEDY